MIPSRLAQVYFKLYRFLLNAFGQICFLCGVTIYQIKPESELEEFRKIISSYKGSLINDGDVVIDGLSTLLECWASDSKLTALGRKLCVSGLRGIVCQRRDIIETIYKEPSICAVPVQRPVFIVGLLRTGTTLLHNILAQDPTLKAPLLWELLYPVPPPQPDTLYSEPRRIQADKDMGFFLGLEPELMAKHELLSTKPDECCHLLERCLIDRHAPITGQCTRPYWRWLMGRPRDQIRQFYEFYKKQLQVIGLYQGMSKRRFVLKDATHMLFLDVILEVFPDAQIINTHRDLDPVIASACSGFFTLSKFFYHPKDIIKPELANRVLEQFSTMTSKLVKVREAFKDKSKATFCDVHFRDLVTDRNRVVKDIYKFLDLEFTDDIEDKIDKYMVENPKDRYGKHEYSLDGFCTKQNIESQLKDYLQFLRTIKAV